MAKLNPEKMTLSWYVKKKTPSGPRLAMITHDYQGKARSGNEEAPGLFVKIPRKKAEVGLTLKEG